MGDRTWVQLNFPAVCKERVKEIDPSLLTDAEEEDEMINSEGVTVLLLEYSEVNYGCLDIEEDFQAAGIPYDRSWGRGDDYNAGAECFRLNPDGTTRLRHVTEDDNKLNIEFLLSNIENHSELKSHILKAQDELHCPPFTKEQIDLHKNWKAIKLLNPTGT
ncbi:hypothetical protein [Marinobacterium litorale]|uniref:hypothetical protein n=1 Tax=Marinobacterium litorale TaxID=404770 RepID=UPI000483E72A|nr:hypothetical protein [Marinobacterium litorale]